jgi:hypothetical protein
MYFNFRKANVLLPPQVLELFPHNLSCNLSSVATPQLIMPFSPVVIHSLT